MMKKQLVSAGLVVAASALSLGLGGCSLMGSAEVPTCSEYADMSPETGLLSSPNEEQKSAITNILSKHDRDTGATNVMLAASQIVAYCNIYEGVANGNRSEPIDNIPGLQD